jgi:hypothetical protein
MPILTIQKQAKEIGRIRIGYSEPGRNGGKTPRRSDTFILTSDNKAALEAAAQVFGGEVRPWSVKDGVFVLVTKLSEMPILVVDIPETQWYEFWNGGACELRCDGETIQGPTGSPRVGKPCLCSQKHPNLADRIAAAGKGKACKPTTRVSVMIPDAQDLGVWRFESHGYYTAAEIPTTLQFIRSALGHGRAFMPATLAISQRSRGSKRFPVFDIRIGQTVKEFVALTESREHTATPALTGGAVAALQAPTDDIDWSPSDNGGQQSLMEDEH